MSKILITGKRLQLRRAELSDLAYIMELQHAPENRRFIVPFSENFHTEIINSDGAENLDIIIEEIETGDSVGYFMVCGLDNPFKGAEWRHVIVGKKGVGYGREGLYLLMRWTFEILKFHRGWLDCKTYNTVALNLYESSGLQREGIAREVICTDGVYEDLVNFSILDREFFARHEKAR